ncbi:MAG: hypothetical protein R2795_16100 [Saprospiraceae bacterium]
MTAGDYIATVTDADGCPLSLPFIITQPPLPDLQPVITQAISCNGSQDGIVTIEISNGNGRTYSTGTGFLPILYSPILALALIPLT